MSPLDKWITAAGRTRDSRAVPHLIRLLDQLNSRSEFSHFRAVAGALESIATPAAAAALQRVLKKPGIRGHMHLTVEEARRASGPSSSDESTRSNSLREIALARAFLKCGDPDGFGRRILEDYRDDLRGHFSRHARAVLDSLPPATSPVRP
ncbi:MAG: hypothetical protein FJW20_12610 [Acidimicrobiia bacterium]|nr:hypothetical protein [Acidimicrobiia bacterium]